MSRCECNFKSDRFSIVCGTDEKRWFEGRDEIWNQFRVVDGLLSGCKICAGGRYAGIAVEKGRGEGCCGCKNSGE